MALVFAIKHLYNIFLFCVVSVHSFLSLNWMEWSMTPACPSLLSSFNRGNIEGINSLKNCM